MITAHDYNSKAHVNLITMNFSKNEFCTRGHRFLHQWSIIKLGVHIPDSGGQMFLKFSYQLEGVTCAARNERTFI